MMHPGLVEVNCSGRYINTAGGCTGVFTETVMEACIAARIHEARGAMMVVLKSTGGRSGRSAHTAVGRLKKHLLRCAAVGCFMAYWPKPYSVRPWRLSAYTTSIAVTVLRFACSVYVTASRMTFSKKVFSTPRVSS